MSYSTNPFVVRARRAPVLGRDEERELIERYRNHNDLAARDRLVESSLRCVVAVAFKFVRYGVALDILFSEGNMGLVRALKKYELSHEVRFATYAAYWVRSYVVDYILKSWSLVGGGTGALKTRTFFRLKREAARAYGLHGEGEEALQVLAERMQLPEEKLRLMVRQLEGRDVSLNTPVRDDATSTPLDELRAPDDHESALGRNQALALMIPACREALSKLNERERFIVEKRLSSDPDEALALSAIAEILGISRQRVRQLEVRARERLRVSLSATYERVQGDVPASAVYPALRARPQNVLLADLANPRQ